MLNFTFAVPHVVLHLHFTVNYKELWSKISLIFKNGFYALSQLRPLPINKSCDSTKVEGLPIIFFSFPIQICFLCSPAGLRAIPLCCFFLKQYCNNLGNKSLESVSSRKNGIVLEKLFRQKILHEQSFEKKKLFRKMLTHCKKV